MLRLLHRNKAYALYVPRRTSSPDSWKKNCSLDWVFVIGMGVVTLGSGFIAGLVFSDPIYEISIKDGSCVIGLPDLITIPLLAYDICINLGVTALFMYYTHRYTRASHTKDVIRRALPIPFLKSSLKLDTQLALLELFVVKSIIGTLVMIISTIANLVVLIKFHGAEQGWLRFTISTCDYKFSLGCTCFIHLADMVKVTRSAIVIHWLTNYLVKPSDLPPDQQHSGGSNATGENTSL